MTRIREEEDCDVAVWLQSQMVAELVAMETVRETISAIITKLAV